MATFNIPGKGAVSEKQFKEYWTGVFRTDPVMQAIFAEASKSKGSEKSKEKAATARAQQLGWAPPDHDWSVDFDKVGFRTERANYVNRNKDWIIPAAIGIGTLGFGAAGMGPAAGIFGGAAPAAGAAGATAAGTAAGTVGPLAGGYAGAISVPASLAAVGAPVAGTAATVGGATALAKAPSLWSKISGPLLSTAGPAATSLIGTKMALDANQRATDAATKATEEALRWQKDVYGQRQTQLAPAIGVGNQATVRLGELMGLETPQGGYQAPPAPGTPQTPPGGPPAPTTPAAPAEPPMVWMKAPTGQVSSVPQSQVEGYKSRGAVVVQ